MPGKFFRKNIDILTVILFFILLFVYGCKAFDGYGISTDEQVQRGHSLVMYNDLFLKDKEYTTATVNTENLPTMKEYGVSYGVILQLPLVFVEHMNDFEMSYQEIFTMRHFYSFLWFFTSTIYFYHLAMILTGGRRFEALLGTLIYVLCPRTLADSFYNIKDGLCMDLFTISMYYGFRLIRKPSAGIAFLFVVFSALCTVSRVVGGVVVAGCILVLILKCLSEGAWKKLLLYCGFCGVMFLAMFVVLMPNTWSDIPGMLLKIIRTFSNYTTWHDDVLYMGKWINALHLPWHYLFVWIFMTVPAVYLLLMLGGICRSVCYCVSKRGQWMNEDGKPWMYLLLLLITIIPFAYVIIVRPVLYNGWRHFYFMYAAIAAWSVLGIHAFFDIVKKPVAKAAGLGILGIVFSWIGLWILRNHPYEYVYYNPWIRRYAADNFQRDYWYVSETDAFRYILEHDERPVINVYAYQGFTWYFDNETGNRLRLVPTPDMADYVVSDEYGFASSYQFEKKMDITVDGMVIRSVYERQYSVAYEREYDVARRAVLMVKGSQVEYELNGLAWYEERTEGQRIYTGELICPMEAEAIGVQVSDSALLENADIRISVSGDGKTWYFLEDMEDYFAYYTQASAKCPISEIQYVRLICDCSYAEEFSVQLDFCRTKGQGAIEHNMAIAALTSDEGLMGGLSNAVDGNADTRWESPNQTKGMYVTAELEDEYTLSGAVLELGESPWDYPENLIISVSMDGEQWRIVDSTTEDRETYYFDEVSCRYIRFELGEVQVQEMSHWSIYELRLLARLK